MVKKQRSPADQPATQTGRIDWVDAAKGISILLVVAHHAVSFLTTTEQAPAVVVTLNTALASLRMPLFFLAAGLFAAAPLAAPWRTLLHKRVAFYLYLFSLWTILQFTFFATVTPQVAEPEAVDPQLQAMALMRPGPVLWFLYALAVFSVVGKVLRRVPALLQLLASGTLSALTGAGIIQFDSFAWTFMCRYLFFFLLGCHARHLVEALARRSNLTLVVATVVVCLTCASGAIALDLRTTPGVALGLNVLAVTFGVLFSAWICRYQITRPLVLLGRNTLPVYLIHSMWLAGFVLVIRTIDLNPVAAYALPVVLTVVSTALSLLTHRLLVKAGAPWLFALPSRLAYREPSVPARVPPQRTPSPQAAVPARSTAPR